VIRHFEFRHPKKFAKKSRILSKLAKLQLPCTPSAKTTYSQFCQAPESEGHSKDPRFIEQVLAEADLATQKSRKRKTSEAVEPGRKRLKKHKEHGEGSSASPQKDSNHFDTLI